MKILIYNWRDIRNPAAGGAEVFTHEIAKRWVGMGHGVTIFTSAIGRCIKEEVVGGLFHIGWRNVFCLLKGR